MLSVLNQFLFIQAHFLNSMLLNSFPGGMKPNYTTLVGVQPAGLGSRAFRTLTVSFLSLTLKLRFRIINLAFLSATLAFLGFSSFFGDSEFSEK